MDVARKKEWIEVSNIGELGTSHLRCRFIERVRLEEPLPRSSTYRILVSVNGKEYLYYSKDTKSEADHFMSELMSQIEAAG